MQCSRAARSEAEKLQIEFKEVAWKVGQNSRCEEAGGKGMGQMNNKALLPIPLDMSVCVK